MMPGLSVWSAVVIRSFAGDCWRLGSGVTARRLAAGAQTLILDERRVGLPVRPAVAAPFPVPAVIERIPWSMSRMRERCSHTWPSPPTAAK